MVSLLKTCKTCKYGCKYGVDGFCVHPFEHCQFNGFFEAWELKTSALSGFPMLSASDAGSDKNKC